MEPLDDRIGVSTLCMPRIPIEVVPVEVEHDPDVEDWQEYFTPGVRQEIRALLRAFPTLTVTGLSGATRPWRMRGLSTNQQGPARSVPALFRCLNTPAERLFAPAGWIG